MREQFLRSTMLYGEENMERLYKSRVAVFGIGGVGGHCAEALARAGIGALDFIDADRVEITNLNRQIIALHSTLGQYKADIMCARARDINPSAEVRAHRLFYGPDTADEIELGRYDYIVDAIDTVTAKLLLITRAHALGIPVISAMGAANKLDPSAFMVADIYETSVCPLARVMRQELRKRGVPALKVVYSKETPVQPRQDTTADPPMKGRSLAPSSNAFAPAVAGLLLAGEVVKDLIG